MKNKIFLVLVLYIVSALPAFAAKTELKVGFLYPGPANDLGWDTSHDEGRRALEKAIPGVITTAAENIPENAQAERVMQRMVAQGNKIIFGASYGYFESALRLAKQHPDISIGLCGRLVPAPDLKNIGPYFMPYYEPLYACGVVAGRMTKSNNLGCVAGFPVANVIQAINAFAIGARSVNPKAVVHVVWTNSWSDPSNESEATKGLIERKSDVVFSILDTSWTVCKTADKAKVYSIATFYDLNKNVPDSWLTGQTADWGLYCTKIVKAIQAGNWSRKAELHPAAAGYVGLASFGKAVPKAVQSEALNAMAQIKAGKKEVFQAPLKDRDGRIRLKEGEKADAAWLDKMDWLVNGVEGPLK
jgi:basic membrane protein A and related proteins